MRLWFFALLGLAAWCGPAYASDTEDQASEVASVERIRVHGDIGQRCSISAPDKSIDLGDLERPGLQANLRVDLNCNTPFLLNIESGRGGLANLAMPQGQGPYAGLLPYTLAVSIPTRHPASSIVSKSFSSQQLVGGQSMTSEGGIATDGMTMVVAMGRPNSDAGLLAGDYSETITLTVSTI